MSMTLTCNRRPAEARRQTLEKYLTANVLSLSTEFICTHYDECRSSHPAQFYEGQLHHVGRFYDLLFNGLAFRIVVVGQEYGGEPAQIDLDARYKDLMSSAFDYRFKADAGYKARNPHMRGTTSVLRLLFGIPLGTDHESEFVQINGERVHLFEAFGLVNYLLCSAIGNDGKARGLATRTMLNNCCQHFREALRILEPSVVIVQGKTFWPWVQKAFDSVTHRAHEVHGGLLGSMQTLVASFTHPAAPYPYNWGTNDSTPYLRKTVVPSITWIRDHFFRSH
jgi:hypothetical protein